MQDIISYDKKTVLETNILCFMSINTDFFFPSTAIYLAKKNIRKQGELMEYERVG